jgi:hypothetical protein
MSRASDNLGLLFDCTTCELYDQCGGSDTGPCGCIHLGTAREYDCAHCPLHCRERRTALDLASRAEYVKELEAGRPLSTVTPNGIPAPALPLFIPTLCDRQDTGTRLEVGWFGVQLTSFLSLREDGSAHAQAWVRRGEIAQAQRVTSSARPIALLHGNDYLLRGFWGMDRLKFYEMLHACGVQVVTAPTFSVYNDSVIWPASESVMMMLHHHRVLDELYRYGFVAAPNLFWRSSEDRRTWVAWLKDHPEVTLLSRDFSCTRDRVDQLAELHLLTEIIGTVGRRMHILLQGIGIGKASATLRELERVGATCSFVTGHPILLGRGGQSVRITKDGRPTRRRTWRLTRGNLGLRNLRKTEAWLVELVSRSPLYKDRDWRNMNSPPETTRNSEQDHSVERPGVMR